MNTKSEWKLPELAQEVGISPRTVRYYVQRGLVPAPEFHGPDTAYGEEHLVRLRAIRRLQERFFPLEAIQVELSRRSPKELRNLADGTEPPPDTPPRHRSEPLAAIGATGHPHSAPRSTAWKRWELLPGLELHLSESADAGAREFAEKLSALAKDQLRREGSR